MAKFQARLGSEWRDFEADTNQLLSTALAAGKPSLGFQERGQQYVVDFEGMVQRNDATGKERDIRVTFQEESTARDMAESRAVAAAEKDRRSFEAKAKAATEREQREQEEALARAAEDRERRKCEEAKAAAEHEQREKEEADARAAEEEDRREREQRENEEAEAKAAAQRKQREREEAEAKAAAECEQRENDEAEAKAAAEREHREHEEVEALKGDKLATGVKMDEEASVLWNQGRLEEANQRLIASTALLQWVHKWDVRTKNPKVKQMIGQRLDQITSRIERLQDEMKLPPLCSATAALAAGDPLISAASSGTVPLLDVAIAAVPATAVAASTCMPEEA